MEIGNRVVSALWLVAVGWFVWWYNERLRHYKKEAAAGDDSPESGARVMALKSRVTAEGFLGMGAVFASLFLLAWLF